MREHLFSAQAEVAWVHVWGVPNWWSNLLGTPYAARSATLPRLAKDRRGVTAHRSHLSPFQKVEHAARA